MKDILERFYNKKYEYEDKVEDNDLILSVRYPKNRFEACIKYFPIFFKGGNIIELGAGSGIVAKSLIATGFDFNRYTITDFSDHRLKRLKDCCTDPRIRTLKIDAESLLEAEYGQYDAVIMVALIDFLIDPLHSMQQIRKLLKPKGFVYISTANLVKFSRRIKLLLGRYAPTSSINEGLTTYGGEPVDLYDEGVLHHFTFRSLSLMLTERCGYVSIIKLPYFMEMPVISSRIGHWFAHLWPEMFSELNLIAYA